jgi:hypothetical protein
LTETGFGTGTGTDTRFGFETDRDARSDIAIGPLGRRSAVVGQRSSGQRSAFVGQRSAGGDRPDPEAAVRA